MEKSNKERLEGLSIFELRDFARQIGVQSPTTMKKQELVDSISDILQGKEEPASVQISKKGRPAKSIATTADFISMFMPQDIEDKPNTDNSDSSDNGNSSWTKRTLDEDMQFSFMQNQASYNEGNKLFDGDDKETLVGLLDIHPKGYGIIRVDNYRRSHKDVYISIFFINRYRLRKGNLLRVVVRSVKEDFPKNVVRLLEIDGVPADDYVAQTCYLQDPEVSPILTYQIGTNQVGECSKSIIMYDNDKPVYESILGLLKNAKNDVYKMLISLNNDRTIDEVQGDVHIVSLDHSYADKDRTFLFDMVFARARRMAEQGHNVLLVIDSLSDLIRSYSVALSDNATYGYVSGIATEKVKDFLAQPRRLKIGGGSITIILVQNSFVHPAIVDVMKYDFYPMLDKLKI